MGIFFILMILAGGFLLYLFLSTMSAKPKGKSFGNRKISPSNGKIVNSSDAKKSIGNNSNNQISSLPVQKILFDAGMDNLQEYAEQSLIELINFLKENPSLKINIVGISDSTGNQTQNKILAKSRAGKTFQFLKGKGIESSRMDTEIQDSIPGISPKDRENLRAVRFEII